MSLMPGTSTASGAAHAADDAKRRSIINLMKTKRVRIGDKEAKEAKDLLGKLYATQDDEERRELAMEAAGYANAYGVRSLKACHLYSAISHELFAKKIKQPEVLASMELTLYLCDVNETLHGVMDPHLASLLPPLLDLQGDKQAKVKEMAAMTAKRLVSAVNPSATRMLLHVLLTGLENSRKWPTKMLSLSLIEELARKNPMQLLPCIPDLIPVVSDTMWDTKAEVKRASTQCMKTVTELLDNKDIERFIPAVIECINHPDKVPETIHQLGATTFVQEVDAGTLSLMVPLLARGLRERQTPIKRKAAVIIDNMCKLVDDPEVAAPFLPVLLPELDHVHDIVADPECRGVVNKALATLKRIGATEEGVQVLTDTEKRDKVTKTLDHLMPTKLEGFWSPVRKFMVEVAVALSLARDFTKASWVSAIGPHAGTWLLVTGREHGDWGEEQEHEAEKLATAALAHCEEAVAFHAPEEEDDDEGEELCNCEFSLAYGAKILLNRTTLKLKRGRRYGLCGANGCGKSTLMRAIANEQVEGFPPKSVLKTVYVEHDIDGSQADTGLVDFIAESKGVEQSNKEEIARILLDYGFSEDMVKFQNIGSLSGGWKMKLALARAMLMNADILLLDEPTNHLDVVNVAWLENYLLGLKTVTSIIVSHDSGFLDHVCSDIIHYEGNYKLKRYKGNLSEFVKKVPRAAAYYSLDAAQLTFKFPEPGYLEGVKTKERAILKMKDVDFQYPGTSRKQLKGITMQCSLASRVAVIGPNGAGKSTLIKLLTGEMEPTSGTVWKHPNLRIAYVAQHAFHHIEKHLDSTPNEYIQWRYATGEDREELDKVDRQVTEEEEKQMNQAFVIDGEKRVIEEIVGRRKLKQSYEYEVSWVGKSSVENTWISRQRLEQMGFGKKIAECDAQEAAKSGLTRPLTAKEIEKHLSEVGLEPEFATHSRIRGLSGGQKVKLVIGAAMWNRPHMLVLDEPTNYLDRESLGALASAIREYGGGVVIVTHNREFSEALCQEVWKVDNGELVASGHNWVTGQGTTVIKEEEQEDMVDAQGNTIKAVKKKEKLSSRELRKKKKERMERRKRGEEVYSDEDEW